MTHSPQQLSEAELPLRIRRAGGRVTPARLLVYRLLHASGGHAGAEDILRLARERGASITPPSVYAGLRYLGEIGAARVAHIGPHGPAVYDVRTDNHHHLLCRICGRTEDAECARGEAACLEPAGAAGFHVERAEVTYVGVCAGCREAEATA